MYFLKVLSEETLFFIHHLSEKRTNPVTFLIPSQYTELWEIAHMAGHRLPRTTNITIASIISYVTSKNLYQGIYHLGNQGNHLGINSKHTARKSQSI